MKKLLLFTVSLVFASNFLYSQNVIGRDVINGKNYYIVLENFSGQPEVWAREHLNMSGVNDVQVGKFTIKSLTNNAMGLICRDKKIYDNGALALGCASTVGSAICVMSGGGGGIASSACVFTISYGVKSGFVDCIGGLSNKIARAIGAGNYFENIRFLNHPTIVSAISKTIDKACSDWKRNK